MLFPILLVVIPSGLLIAGARWAKTDEDDWIRKIVVGVVQLMCLASMVVGVAWFAQRAANGPPQKEQPEVNTAPSGPSAPRQSKGGYIPPRVQFSPLATQSQSAQVNQAPTPNAQDQTDPNPPQSTDPSGPSQLQTQPDSAQPPGSDTPAPDSTPATTSTTSPDSQPSGPPGSTG